MTKNIRSISELLLDLKNNLKTDRVTIGMILDELHERGFGVLLFFFAVPIALPFPVPPGINIAFAAPLLVLTAQLLYGRDTVWMPEKMKARSFSRKILEKTIDICLPWMRRIEYLIKPRLAFMTQGVAANIVGLLGLIMAASIYIPIPLTNTVPGMGICAMAIGLLMRDGLAVLIGGVVGTAWVFMMLMIVVFLGAEGIDIVKETIKGFL